MEIIQNLTLAAGGVGGDVFAAKPGQICMANAQVSYRDAFSQDLTNYASGIAAGTGLKELREFLAPTVNVTSRRVEYQEITTPEAIKKVTIDDAVRAHGGEFRSLTIDGEVRTVSLKNYGFSMPVEYADLKEDKNLDRESVDILTEFTDTVELLWAHRTLSALAIEQEISLATTPDIDSVIRQAIIENHAETGVTANRIFFGGMAWAKRDQVYRANMFKNGSAVYAKNEDELGNELGLEVMAGNPRTISAMGAMPLVGSNEILAFFALKNPTRFDATNVKFFAGKGLNGSGTEVYQSTSYQGTIKHSTVSRYGLPVVGNGFGVLKFKLVD